MTPADRLAEIRARADAMTLEVGYPDLLAWANFQAHAREDVPYLLERIEALEKVAADARTAVHYSRITIELAASIAALDALEQP